LVQIPVCLQHQILPSIYTHQLNIKKQRLVDEPLILENKVQGSPALHSKYNSCGAPDMSAATIVSLNSCGIYSNVQPSMISICEMTLVQ